MSVEGFLDKTKTILCDCGKGSSEPSVGAWTRQEDPLEDGEVREAVVSPWVFNGVLLRFKLSEE